MSCGCQIMAGMDNTKLFSNPVGIIAKTLLPDKSK